jgi:hypothetical protein
MTVSAALGRYASLYLTTLTALAAPNAAFGATKAEIMQSRYLRYQFCMEKVYGQGFYDRLGLVPVVNRWGASEPTLSSLVQASESVQKNEARCRAESDIGLEPRPR